MDSSPTYKGRYESRCKIKLKSIDFNVVTNLHVLIFLLQAVFLAYLARPDPIKMISESSPLVLLAFSFLYAKDIYRKIVSNREKILPIIRCIQSSLKEEFCPEIKELSAEEKKKEQQKGLVVLPIMLTVSGLALTFCQDNGGMRMKIFWTLFWFLGDVIALLLMSCSSENDVLKNGGLGLAICCSIGATQCCYTGLLKCVLLKWALIWSLCVFILSLFLWSYLYSRGTFDDYTL